MELFQRDPLTWSEPDLEKMVDHYRKMRTSWDLTGKGEKAAKASKAPKEDVSGLSASDLLSKLGLDV